jgi:hypothetical protein
MDLTFLMQLMNEILFIFIFFVEVMCGLYTHVMYIHVSAVPVDKVKLSRQPLCRVQEPHCTVREYAMLRCAFRLRADNLDSFSNGFHY